MIIFNMILHVSCIMNKGSEGIGEQENNLCHTAKKNIRRSTCVVCPGSLILQLSPVLCSIHCLTILQFDNIILHCLHF